MKSTNDANSSNMNENAVTAPTITPNADLPAWAQNQPAPPDAGAQTAPRGQGPTAAPQPNLPETFSAKDVYDNSKHGQTNKKQWGG
jgi:hypothetical protein